MAKKLYKVLLNGQSFHGGSMKWDLPKKSGRTWTAGKWHAHKGNLEICSSGLHLTDNPVAWWKPNAKFFLVEAEGISDRSDDKVVARRVRLLKEVPLPDFLKRVEDFILTIPHVKFFHPENPPLKSWTHHTAGAAARAASWGAAWGASWAASWGAARAASWGAAWGASGDASRDASGAAAWDASRDAAWAASGAAAWDASRDAAWAASGAASGAASRAASGAAAEAASLMARCLVVSDLDSFHKKHLRHAEKRWDVWKRGYGLFCDVNGKLFTYGGWK